MTKRVRSKEEKLKRSRSISEAKSDPEHRKMMSDIMKEVWKRPEFREKALQRTPHNKLGRHQLIQKPCANCNEEMNLVPSRKDKKFCSKVCFDMFRTGKPHKNWNENSKNNSIGYGNALCGLYKGHVFRSLYELSLMVELEEKSLCFKEEPFHIHYFSTDGTERRYYPDLLVEGHTIIEVKPKRFLIDDIVRLKIKAAKDYCNRNGMKFLVFTEDEINILSKKEVQGMIDNKEIMIDGKCKTKGFELRNSN